MSSSSPPSVQEQIDKIDDHDHHRLAVLLENTSRTASSSPPGYRCLKAIRKSTHHIPPARILESSTNELHRAMEFFLVREISSLKSANYIARNLSSSGIYNDRKNYPAAYKYLHKNGPLTADAILGHMYWRVRKKTWFPAAWEKELMRVAGGLERLAWAVHEGGGGSVVGARRCSHGRKV